MGIKIKVSDHVRFKVAGSINSEAGAAEDFEFWVVARRLKSDALADAIARRSTVDLVREVITDWSGVLDDNGAAVPYSEAARDQLLDIVGIGSLICRAYVNESGAKEKN